MLIDEPEGLHPAFLLLTVGPDAEPGRTRDVRVRAESVLGELAGAPARSWELRPHHYLISTDPGLDARVPNLRSGRDITLLLGCATRWAPDLWAPPMAVCQTNGARGPIRVRTDACGLQHVYWHQHHSWAAASTSSLMLARLAGAAPDEHALGTLAAIGHLLGDQSAYQGVHKVPGGYECELCDGTAQTVRHLTSREQPWPRARRSRREAVETGVAVLRERVGSYLASFPDAAIELSGGLDSRAVLAAIPTAQRHGRRAVCLVSPGDADGPVSEAIARACGLDRQVIDLGGLASLSPRAHHGLAVAASRRRDHQMNPLAGAVLDWVEARIPRQARLTGANGEYARGFYYPGQRSDAVVTNARVRRLTRWRLLTNDAADLRIFRQPVRDELITELHQRIRACFPTGAAWLDSTDEFYLGQRMQRWVGGGYSVPSRREPILAPFFSSDFIDWTRRTDPRDRRGSSLFAEVVHALDPDLAAMPLDRGNAVTALFDRSPAARMRRGEQVAKKYGRKVHQRLASSSRPPAGADAVCQGVLARWRESPEALAELEELPFVDPGMVASIARGDVGTGPATVGLLLSLSGMVRDLVRRDPRTEPVKGLALCRDD